MASVVATAKLPESSGTLAAPQGAGDWRRCLLLFLVACGTEAIVLGTVAARRAVNPDEGFYLLAGWRVLAGLRPYRDFFFPQMPYLPYAEAAVLADTGPSLFAGRAISVVSGALLAGVMAVAAARRAGEARVGVAIALAYLGNALILSYVSIAKPYGVVNLPLVGAFLLLAPAEASTAQVLAAGACAGLAVGARLPAAAATIVLLVWSARGGMRHVLAFGAGVMLGSLLWLWVAAQDPANFWFCNFGFHEVRREISGFGPIMRQKSIVLAKWILLPQNLLLWILAAAGLRRQPWETLPAAACAAALALVYLAATPTYLEYLVQVTPFLLLMATPAVVALLPRRSLTVGAAAIYFVGLIAAGRTAPDTSQRGAKARLWQLGTVRTVTTYLQAHSAPDDRILSWWEGYPLLADRPGFIGVGFWESNVAKKLSPEARQRYHVLGRGDIRQLVMEGQARLVVFPDGTWEDLTAPLGEHYRLAARFGAIQVFERREPAAATGAAGGAL